MLSFQNSIRLLPLALVALSACSDQSPTATQDITDPRMYTAPAEPADGEFIRATGTDAVYLVFGRTLYALPDMQTLRACTGGREQVVRQVSSLPAWTQKVLPSAGDPAQRPHGGVWMFGDRPVQSNLGGAAYAVVGCVRSGIPSPETYQAIYGDQNWGRIVTLPDAVLKALPEGPVASAVPLRRAGSLVESGGTIRWVTFHGGSLGIPDPQTMDSYCRPWSDMTSSATEYNVYQQKGLLQPGPTSGCLRGNDYTYNSGVMNNVDPWNFYTRQCTSFVAWRLNQDGIEFHNGYLQPAGYRWSNADLWDDAALRAGLVVNKTPKKGAVAQWNSMHVAYVAAVHNDGYVTLEDYNSQPNTNPGRYSSRRVLASSVENYIHFR